MKKLFILVLLITHFFGYGQYTLIPDVNFEKALIGKGIDNGTPDGKVLMANVKGLISLEVFSKNITDLTGIQDFIALTALECDDNNLTNLDVSNNASLWRLSCSSNQLTSMKINISLTALYCPNNQLASLDVSKNNSLFSLYCSGNLLTSLDISKNFALAYLDCSGNQLKSLDVSKNTFLTHLWCISNQLNIFNLNNGNNTKLININFTNNPNLKCIQVDNKSYSDTNWSTKKDAAATFSEDCSKIAAPIGPPAITATGNQIYCPGTPLKIVETISIAPDPAEPTTNAVYVQISSGYVSGQDLLTLTGIHPNVSSNWIQLEGKLNLYSTTGNKIPYSEFEAAFKDVTFDNNSTSISGSRTFSISLGTGSLSYLPSNSHYYEYVSSPGINWTKARNEAAARKYYGQQGYLATLTTIEEAQLAGAQSAGTGWIGGSDAAIEGEWKWVTGPEIGTTFWIGKSSGITTSPFNFANWNAPLEPNDSNNNEDYAHITSTSVGNIGTWNDMTEQGDPPGDYYPNGFIVEYGGMPGDPVLKISASTSLTVGKIEIVSAPSPICNSGTAIFKASANGLPIKWYDSSTGGTLLHTGTDFTTLVLTSDKSYFADAGCTSTPRTEFKAIVNAIPIITATKTSVSLCGAGAVVLDAVASVGIINWYNAPTGGSLLGTGTPFKTPNITAKTTFYAEALNNSCVSALRVPIEVIVYPLPIVSDQQVTKCKSIDKELDADLLGMSYLWSTGAKTQKITVSASGIYFVDITSPSPEKCTSRKIITVLENNIPEIDRVEVNEASAIIYLKKEEIYFEYSIDGINYQASNAFFNLPIGLQTAYVREVNFCSKDQKDFTIFTIKKYFTPNNDGFNDLWEITEMKNFPNSSASIYDRYGKLIIYLNASNYSWDGRFNNNPLPADDYWYSLKLDNSKPEVKGHFSLKR